MAETTGELPGTDAAGDHGRGRRADRRGPDESAVPDRSEGAADTAGEGIREARVTVSRADYETIGIARLVDRWQAAGLRRSETIACREGGPVVQVSVADPLDLEDLRSLAEVETADRARAGNGDHGYVLALAAPRFPTSLAERADGLFGTCDCAVDADRLTTSLVGPQPAIADAIAAYRDAGMAPRLERLGSVTARDHALGPLTDRQVAVLEAAYRLGYYDVPRAVTAADVAAELDVGQSTVLEHLRRAERNLLRDRLAPEGG